MSKVLISALALMSCIGSAPANAEPLRGVMYAGGTVSESLSGYAGGILSLPGAQLGDGLGLKAGVAAGRYEYDASGTRIVGKYASTDVALVLQNSGQWGWANISAGPHYADTSLSPNDPGNRLRGSRWDLALQTDGALDGKNWRLGWYGSIGAFDEAYQARLQLGRRVGIKDIRLGVEAGIQGDPSYRKGFGGIFASKPVGNHFEIMISAGATAQAGRGSRGYGAIGLSKLF